MDASKTLMAKIHEAVRAASRADQRLAWSAEMIARHVIEKNRDLVDIWMFQRLTSLVRVELRARPDPRQLCLPGLMSLARRLPLEDGFIRLGDATITDLRNAARTIQKQARHKLVPRAARVHELIELMEPYSKRHHGLTVAQFYAMRARRGSAAAPTTATTATSQASMAPSSGA